MKRKPIPFKRSTEVEEQILTEIKHGMPLDGAALLHGIHSTSFLRWRRCELSEAGSDRDERCWRCRGCRLQQKVDCALESFKAVHLKRIADATNREGDPVWQASAWLLERRFKDEFALKTVMDNRHSVDIGNQNAENLVAAILRSAV